MVESASPSGGPAPTGGVLLRELRRAFCRDGRPDPVLVALFVLINGLVLFNTVVYEPNFPGDAAEFKRYTAALAEGRLPDKEDSREFFTPPLPFVVPAALLAVGVPSEAAFKVGQNLNLLYSAALLFVVLLLVEELRPGDRSARRVALLLLALLPVYQHAFVTMRGEPALALGAAGVLLLAVRALARTRWSLRALAGLGLAMGLMLLARQQGVFVILAVVAYAGLRLLVEPAERASRLRALALGLAVAGVVGGWFFLSLWQRYGSPMAFNKPRVGIDLRNRPLDFYFGTGNGELFRRPIRPHFTGQFLPTLYADAWGDYYGYFLVYVFHERKNRFVPPWEWEKDEDKWRDADRFHTNLYTRPAYLGRTNVLALAPTALCLLGLVGGALALPRLAGRDPAPDVVLRPLLALSILLTLGGYFVLLLSFPLAFARGTTIKSIYMIQVFPLFAILGADALARLQTFSLPAFKVGLGVLVAVLLHNAPLLVTAYWPWP